MRLTKEREIKRKEGVKIDAETNGYSTSKDKKLQPKQHTTL